MQFSNSPNYFDRASICNQLSKNIPMGPPGQLRCRTFAGPDLKCANAILQSQPLISGNSLAEVGIGAKSGSYSSPYVVGTKYNLAFCGASAGTGERNRSRTGWPGISSWLLEIGEKVMVWKMGSTDRSIVVIAEEFLLLRDGKSFLRISSPHPKG